jgi:hypothetical protein
MLGVRPPVISGGTNWLKHGKRSTSGMVEQLGAVERARRSCVAGRPADQRQAGVRVGFVERVEDRAPGLEARIEGGLARAGEHDRDRLAFKRRGLELEAQWLVRQVAQPAWSGDRAAFTGDEVLDARGVVVAHPGERRELEVLIAAGVVEHPVPLARDFGQACL